MILDSKLNWGEHIKTLKAKAQRSLNILKILSKLHHGPGRPFLLKLYWAICKSKLDYGSQLYASARPTLLKLLDPIHNEALRLCTGAFRSSPASSLQVEANEMPLNLQREETALKYLMKYK